MFYIYTIIGICLALDVQRYVGVIEFNTRALYQAALIRTYILYSHSLPIIGSNLFLLLNL